MAPEPSCTRTHTHIHTLSHRTYDATPREVCISGCQYTSTYCVNLTKRLAQTLHLLCRQAFQHRCHTCHRTTPIARPDRMLPACCTLAPAQVASRSANRKAVGRHSGLLWWHALCVLTADLEMLPLARVHPRQPRQNKGLRRRGYDGRFHFQPCHCSVWSRKVATTLLCDTAPPSAATATHPLPASDRHGRSCDGARSNWSWLRAHKL